MLPFTPINSRDTKTTIRGFENSQFIMGGPVSQELQFIMGGPVSQERQFTMGGPVSQERQFVAQPTNFPVFDPKLFSMGAESSSQLDHQKEHKNIDRGFLSQRNYEQETSERLNGFSIIPRDTRHDTTKKTAEQQISPINNRTTGIPFHKI
jgi:putative AlgH/UPF0301 family transcriptional regulator